MNLDYWQRQEQGKPLFEDLLWSRPENRRQAGKLAIVGGNSYGFAAVAEAFQNAINSGVGTARVMLPESLRKTVGLVLAEGEFATANPSGSFAQSALSEWLSLASWSDAVLVAGDLGRNSETAIVLEKFSQKYQGSLIITKDAADYFVASPQTILERTDTTLVISLAQLQKLFQSAKSDRAITYSMDMLQLIEALHDFTGHHSVEVIVKHLDNLFVAVKGQVSSTKLNDDQPVWRVKLAAAAAVWRLQNPGRPFEALTTAVAEFK